MHVCHECHLPTLHCTVIGLTCERFVDKRFAYLRERICELNIGAFFDCKDSKICFVCLAYGMAIVKVGE